MAGKKYFEWSRMYLCCRVCSTSTVKHKGHGICENCHQRYSVARRGTDLTLDDWMKSGARQRASANAAVYKEPTRSVRQGLPPVDTNICKGLAVTIPAWKIDGVCLTEPYDWPRNEDPICKAVDIMTMVSRVDGVPLHLVKAR